MLAQSAQDDTVTKLEKLIPDLMRRADVPGVAIALIEDARIVWVGSFGVKNVETLEPVNDRTVFEAASISKPVFTLAILKLVDEGKLDLDAPLSRYIPSYIENDDRVNLITARMALTHRTGFPNWRYNTSPLRINFRREKGSATPARVSSICSAPSKKLPACHSRNSCGSVFSSLWA